MKPNFALTLSFEGIGLLHRAFPGWHLVGEIDLDNTDLLSDLRRLREKAVALDPSGVRSKLVIPNDQIKYVRFEAAGTPPSNLPDLVKKKLDGATPYALSDLVFDWSEEDGTVTVAAVARETLREAEAFAKDHQFNPISFVAIPENGDFAGEPFFGETAYASELAQDGETVERDPVPVRIIGAAKLPDAGLTADRPDPEPAPVPVFEPAASRVNGGSGFAEPAAVFEPQDAQDPEDQPDASARDTPEAAPPEPEPITEKPDVTTFSSIRAHRSGTPTSAPKLEGVARHFIPVPASAEVVAESLPRDPESDPGPEPETAPPDQGRIPPAPPEFIPEAPTDLAAFTSRRVAPVIAATSPRYGNQPLGEQQRMTVFGARETDAVGGKPRYLALILTAILLLFLAGVAVWASVFLDEDLASFFRDDDELIIADVPALPETATEDGAQTTPQPDEIIASLSPPEEDIDGVVRDTLSQPKPAELTEDEARARYAATGIWLVAPQIPQAPTAGNLDEFYQTSIDSQVTIQDAVALPDMATWTPDERPQTPNSPARAGTTFALDDRGLVVATPQGALSQDGILIYAGRPPVTPVAMPKREIVQEVLPPDDPAVQRLLVFRPKTRPEDLTEQNERGNLSGRTLNELAVLRPKLRPQSAQELAEQNTRQAAAQTTVQPFIDLDAVNSAVTEAVATSASFSNVMPQAVASSLKPNTRPRNFDSIVQRSTDGEQAAVAVSASQRVTPRIPTTSSVAKQATQRNVLQMRKVNLIGVYGTPNSRRALVRLSNGRYRKVKVGDRLDGGKVSAIGDSELRYRKSGRNVILKMPRG